MAESRVRHPKAPNVPPRTRHEPDRSGSAPGDGAAALVYDGDCGFCRWAVDRLLARDRYRRLRALAFDDPRARSLLASVPRERRFASWHLVTPEGTVLSAGAAVAPLLRLLPGAGGLAALAATFPRTTDRLYRWTAAHRRPLGWLLRQDRVDASAPACTRPEMPTARASDHPKPRPCLPRRPRGGGVGDGPGSAGWARGRAA